MYIHDEEQRYGRNKNTQINHSYINSSAYRRKFDNITDSPELNRLIYQMAKEMLIHRSGTLIEDMCWIDSDSETVIYYKNDETDQQIIHVTDAIEKKLNNYQLIIPIHTHPSSMPPSPVDFNCMLDDKYIIGIVLCHDGKIFIYSSNKRIDSDLWSKYVEIFLYDGYDEYEAQILALEKFQDDIDFEEV
nr:hypothetical protein [uncultured Lachnoclostridium sp.]